MPVYKKSDQSSLDIKIVCQFQRYGLQIPKPSEWYRFAIAKPSERYGFAIAKPCERCRFAITKPCERYHHWQLQNNIIIITIIWKIKPSFKINLVYTSRLFHGVLCNWNSAFVCLFNHYTKELNPVKVLAEKHKETGNT